MRINKYWALNRSLRPARSFYLYYKASRKQYDSVTIIHYGEYFKPFVLTEYSVKSDSIHQPKQFYKGICHLLSSDRPKCKMFSGYLAGYNHYAGIKKWGCRKFTDKQLKTIKETMEWHFSKEQLGLR